MRRIIQFVLILLTTISCNAQQEIMIENPILTGFNPDPSILRVNDDYYIATSTFMWFPGVQIHHSKDLVNWRLLTHPLTRTSQLNMDGARSSEGVWAPCLSWSNGKFYLIYTNVKTWEGNTKGTNNDTHNYLVTAENIEGPWSEPIYMNSSGFDPSLFHDDDGKKWFLNMEWDSREGKERFAGILLQEYSEEEQKLVGEAVNIYPGSGLGATEAPHLYRHNGYYYLIVAEGGTEYWHAVVVARSKNIAGPYESDPNGAVITARNKPDLYLQKAGHGSLVETQNGELYVAHLVGRPLQVKEEPVRRCILGRETAIQKMQWTEDGWLRMADGSSDPKKMVEAPELKSHPFAKENPKDEFKASELSVHFNSPRLPVTEDWASLKEKQGSLTIRGRESLTSTHHVSLIARRVKHFSTQTTTAVDFEPTSFQHLAGLTAYYDGRNHYMLAITHDEELGKVLKIIRSDSGKFDEINEAMVSLPEGKTVHLRATIDSEELQFSWSLDGKRFTETGPVLDASILSDEYDGLNFTGAFIGMSVHDYRTMSKKASFDYFEYIGH
ncbi:MAG: glycoside hydrolase family 43 protein [Bacteroidota bacterium]